MAAKARENMQRDEERAAARAKGQNVAEETWRWSREETYTGLRFDYPKKR